MYRIHGTVVYMSMSADASCRGLRSPRDGPTILELTQGTCISVSVYDGDYCVAIAPSLAKTSGG